MMRRVIMQRFRSESFQTRLLVSCAILSSLLASACLYREHTARSPA